MKPLPLLIACSTALTCVVACSRAQARELTKADLRLVEQINQTRNRERYDAHIHDCNSFAVNKLFDLLDAGFTPDDIRLAKVVTGAGQGHAVTEVVGTVNGKPVVIVLDNRFSWTVSRALLESDYGYRWLAEAGPMPAAQTLTINTAEAQASAQPNLSEGVEP